MNLTFAELIPRLTSVGTSGRAARTSRWSPTCGRQRNRLAGQRARPAGRTRQPQLTDLSDPASPLRTLLFHDRQLTSRLTLDPPCRHRVDAWNHLPPPRLALTSACDDHPHGLADHPPDLVLLGPVGSRAPDLRHSPLPPMSLASDPRHQGMSQRPGTIGTGVRTPPDRPPVQRFRVVRLALVLRAGRDAIKSPPRPARTGPCSNTTRDETPTRRGHLDRPRTAVRVPAFRACHDQRGSSNFG